MSADNLLLSLTFVSSVRNILNLGLLKYDQEVYEKVMELFDCLPLSALVNNKFLCIHGGISQEIRTVNS